MINVPSNFRVIAIISTFNEEDIIVPIINHLFNEGVSVYLIDNWSTDRTLELTNQLRHSTFLIEIERWPKDGPSLTYDWEEILNRKEVISQTLDADWFMHYDADEIRESPWKGIKLRDAIYIVDQHGYNAIDFELLNFHPVDNNYQPGSSPAEYFKYFLFNDFIGDKVQIKAWKRQAGPINLSMYGGHAVEFEGRKVFPYKFIMRHYPIRSQAHGERKVLLEREQRINPLERKRGWHIQYNHFHEGTNFLKDNAELIKFRPSFYNEFMIKQIFEREQVLEELPNQIIELKKEIQRANSHATALGQELEVRNAKIVSLTDEIAERDIQNIRLTQDIAALNNELVAMRNELVAMRGVIEEKDNILSRLLNSRSWRITRPLRQIDAVVRKLGYFETAD
jgi:hypothetical protein